MPDELLTPIDNITAPARPDFPHAPGAHCESSAITALVRREGLPMTEALSFGLTSTLAYCYFPFVRINGLPLLSYRMMPRHIVRNMKRLLRLPLRFERFRSADEGMARLDALLNERRLVGLQGSIMHLTYFPLDWRFPFNAHNFIAYGRDDVSGDYHISDPVFAIPSVCRRADMLRARFVRGALAPNGFLYYLDGRMPSTDLSECVAPLLRGAIRKNAFMMNYVPVPFVATMGMRFFAARMRRLPVTGEKAAYSRDFVGHIARMQEEIGTGGAGFRYLYAAFLKEAGALLNEPVLGEFSQELGDAICPDWRNLAMLAARQNKGRDPLDPRLLADLLDAIAAKERAFFKKIYRAI